VDPAVQLNVLSSDPGERRQLAGTGHPGEATLRAELEAWIETYDAWPPPGHAEPNGLDPALLEELRGLGYLGE
jgi:hypothetical protein